MELALQLLDGLAGDVGLKGANFRSDRFHRADRHQCPLELQGIAWGSVSLGDWIRRREAPEDAVKKRRRANLVQRGAKRLLEPVTRELEEEQVLPGPPSMGPRFDPADVDVVRGEATQHFEKAPGPVLQGEKERGLVPAARLRFAGTEHEKSAGPAGGIFGRGIEDRKTKGLRDDRRGDAKRFRIEGRASPRLAASRDRLDFGSGRERGAPALPEG